MATCNRCWLCQFCGNERSEQMQHHLNSMEHVEKMVSLNLLSPLHFEHLKSAHVLDGRRKKEEEGGGEAAIGPNEEGEAKAGLNRKAAASALMVQARRNAPRQKRLKRGRLAKSVSSFDREDGDGSKDKENAPRKVHSLTCMCCDVEFECSRDLSIKKHTLSGKHAENKESVRYSLYKCNQCQNQFLESQIFKHLTKFNNKKRGGDPFADLRCHKIWRGLNSVAVGGMLRCKSCKIEFDTMHDALLHANRPGPDPPNKHEKFSCTLCKRAIGHVTSLILHGLTELHMEKVSTYLISQLHLEV